MKQRKAKRNAATMAHYLGRFKGSLVLALLPLLLICGMQAAASLITAEVFQRVFEGDLAGLVRWMLVLAGTWLLVSAISTLSELLQARMIYKLNNAVRADMAATLLAMDYGQYHSAATGDYLSRFTNDVNQIENLAWKPFFQFVGVAATAAFSVIALLTLHWSLLLAALLTTLLMVFVPQLFNKRMEKLGDVCAREQAAANSVFQDQLSGWDVLKLFAREGRFTFNMGRASEQIERPRFRLGYVKGLVGAGVLCVNVICQVVVTGLVGFLAVAGYTQAGSLAAGGNLCGMLSNSLGSMAGLLLSFSSARPFFEKITARAGDSPAKAGEAVPVEREIAVENLGFCYGEKAVLKGLSLRFQRGGKYALTGPSGCGKSTLLKLLLGWLPGYEGAIRLDGRDAKDFTPEQVQAKMSYIAQDVYLFDTTIRDNITLGEEFGEAEIRRALQDSALAGDLEKMPQGLETPVGQEGSNLSGGQRQRVAIARALLHRRSILLVDEGTSALDAKNADIVEKSLLANPELTLILVSHHLTPERKKQFTQVYELQAV